MTEKYDREAILRKLSALLAKKEGTTSADEAAAAAAAAQRLMLRYNILAEEIKTTSSDDYVKEDYEVASTDAWLRRLLIAVGRANFCNVLFYSRKHREKTGHEKLHIIIGEPVNVTATKLLYEYLEATLRRLGVEAHDREIAARYALIGASVPKPLPRGLRNERRTWVANFYAGALDVLENRLYRQRQEFERGQMARNEESDAQSSETVAADTSKALIVVKDAALKEAQMRFFNQVNESKWSGGAGKRFDRPGHFEGVRAGSEISLAPQIAEAPARERIGAGK